jgi:organic hydroperoxide reductase OsmC/OhrA
MEKRSKIKIKTHQYQMKIRWTGNKGIGTSDYRAYGRDHTIRSGKKKIIECSSDPAFRGDPARYNPEELLVATLSACHMLWYLHLCAEAGIVVTDYIDEARGIMEEFPDGGGHFTEVVLYPRVSITESSRISEANDLHKRANELCFIATSVKFPVHHRPVCRVAKK